MAFDFPNSPTVGQTANGYTWDGEKWTTTGGATAFSQFEYTATNGQTTFSGADVNGVTMAYTAGFLEVFVNGVRLNKVDFTATSGTSVVLGAPANLGDTVTVVTFTSFNVANTLVPANNLSDVVSKPSARSNLGIYNNASVQSGNLGSASTTGSSMCGYGSTMKLTPVNDGRVLVNFQGSMNGSLTGGQVYTAVIAYGTGTPPVAGAAAAGTVVGQSVILQEMVANYLVPFAVSALITGLTVGTQYWFDLLITTNGGTNTINTASGNAMEF